jgi:cupin 2 domain-containing protein
MAADNLLAGPAGSIDEEIFEQLLDSENVRIERIISKGHHSPPGDWYDQERDEWVLLLKGGATLTFDPGGDVELEPGSYVNIPAHTRHRVKWTRPDCETLWLAIHYRAAGP